MNDDNIAIRLKLFMDSEGLSNSQFADMCGIPRPSLSQILTGRNKKISDVLVGQIHKAFPKLSILWLMFGEGSMTNDPAPEDALFSDVGKFSDAPVEFIENGEENGLEEAYKTPQSRMNKGNSEFSRGVAAGIKVEKSMENPRRVSHITVYYEDSTFETFYPKK